MPKTKAGKNKAVIMDRDGTILRDSHYLADSGGIEIFKGVIPSLKKLSRKGWKLIIGTNQSGIGRGYFDLKALKQIHDRLLEIFLRNGVHIHDIFFCPHHPDDGCRCRKPEIGMLLQAAKKYHLNLNDSVVIGDKESDIEWGRRAGAKTILVLTGKGLKTRSKMKSRPDHVAKSFAYAAEWILNHER